MLFDLPGCDFNLGNWGGTLTCKNGQKLGYICMNIHLEYEREGECQTTFTFLPV